jgi:small subunit ribosomal protein S1
MLNQDYDVYVNKTMEFKVVNHEFKTLLYLTKRLLKRILKYRKRNHRSITKGQVLEGVVKNITGVFIDLGGVDGLIHITDLSWSRINHPSEVLELDQN